MKIVTKYLAFDGDLFDSEADCRAHERLSAYLRLVGLTLEQVEAAITGKDVDLADALETIGTKIARARRDGGDLRRRRRRLPPPNWEPFIKEAERLAREEADFHEGRDEPLPEDMEVDR